MSVVVFACRGLCRPFSASPARFGAGKGKLRFFIADFLRLANFRKAGPTPEALPGAFRKRLLISYLSDSKGFFCRF
ncbi:hypothetical protein [Pseudomonas oryzae]|uniref:hypothetical protein n=1 Tax=Pseudomonas oryzae TaxID=1392877 RepID=UPI0012FD3894|nr:hypothetical protein [Pseudomonas oryzae]